MYDVLLDRYIARTTPRPDQIVAAWIDLRRLTFEDYIRERCLGNRAAILREVRRAVQRGYDCRQLNPRELIDEIVVINHSKARRCGRAMTAPYCRSAAQLHSDAHHDVEFQHPVCPCHYDRWWGVFQPHGVLVGYIRVRRNGNYALIAQLLGHGEHLSNGVMYLLHHEVMRWLCDSGDRATGAIDHLIYGGMDQGGDGLQRWKHRMGYRAAFARCSADDVASSALEPAS